MTVAMHRGMTLEEFLAWDEGQEDRWEFDGFAPVAMVGGTLAHARICRALSGALSDRLRGGPCEVFTETVRIQTGRQLRLPDVLVTCGPNANDVTIAQNPVVVFEILSASTASTDAITKNAEYRATPSIQRYVMLAQDRIAATVFERRGTEWVGTLITDPAAVLDMPEIGASLPLLACYENVLPAP